MIAPGFIDLLGQSEYNVLVDGRAASKITQGITTEVTGEGVSIAPVNERMLAEGRDVYARYGYTPEFRTLDGYFETFERRGASINLGTLVGAGGIRDFVIGKEDRRATPDELERMCALVDEAMREGALGLSSSLQYVPDMYNSTEELVAMAKVAARHGGAYFTHQRSESGQIDASLDEVFRIAERGGDPHAGVAPEDGLPAELRPHGRRSWPGSRRRARAASTCRPTSTRGTAPRTGSTRACRRGCARAGARRCSSGSPSPRPARGSRRTWTRRAPSGRTSGWARAAAEGVMVAEVLSPELKRYEGKTIASIAAAERKDPRDVLIDIVLADRANAYCILSIMDEADVRTALAHPLVSFDTDSQAKAQDGPFAERPPTRAAGARPRASWATTCATRSC